MSVEKFKPVYGEGKIRHETKPYAQILAKVLNECENLEALGLWCHFQGKPEDWIISVQYVQNHFKVGRDKAYNIMRYLIQTNLMEQVQEKRADGTFAGNYYIIKNGEHFKKLSTPLPENPHPENPHPENPTTTYKSNTTYKSKETNRFNDLKKNNPVNNHRNTENPSTGYVERNTMSDEYKETKRTDPESAAYQAFINSVPSLARKHRKETPDATVNAATTPIQPEMACQTHAGLQGARFASGG